MSKKILVIDDNHEVRDMLTDLLMLKGYSVNTQATGADAVEHLGDIEPDLIICDIAMPEKDGFEVLEDVRAHPDYGSVPFIFLTASMVRSEEQKIINTTANGYIMKPYDSRKLFEMLEKQLTDDETS